MPPPGRLRARYGAGLALAYLLTAAEVVAIAVSLSAQSVTDAQALLSTQNLIATVVLVALGTAAVSVGGVLLIEPAVRLLESGDRELGSLRRVRNLTHWQSAILLTPWGIAAAVMLSLNADKGGGVMAVIAFAVMFGTTATVATGFLFTQSTLRPVMTVTAGDLAHAEAVPGVRARLILMWTVCTALPGAGIVALTMLRRNGWLISQDASVEVPVLVLAIVAVMLGLRAMIVVSRSISDPVRDVVAAMAEVERGDIGRLVDVYERSEIGRLQSGFNRMVIGLRERDRLRDLFGRHVGPEVVRRAIEGSEAVAGDVRDAAVLFIDLVGSTELATHREPQQVADILNEFFRIVVAAVDDNHGLVNKFQGDAALAVFGAPLPIDRPATAALTTARTLSIELGRLSVDFGIGVSAGPVFAGNIGAENRYEYTVVGDAVNEAARLADRAKGVDTRVLCSGVALRGAGDAERRRWAEHSREVLRGRADPTDMWAPTAPR